MASSSTSIHGTPLASSGKEQKASSTAPSHVLEALENLPTPPQMKVPRSPLDSRRLSEVLSEGAQSGSKGDHDSFASALNETVNETQDLSFVSAANESSSFLSMASPEQQKAAAAAAAAALAKAVALKKAADEAEAEARRKQEAAELRATEALALADKKQARVEELEARIAAMEREIAAQAELGGARGGEGEGGEQGEGEQQGEEKADEVRVGRVETGLRSFSSHLFLPH